MLVATLSPREFTYVAACLGGETVPLLENPFSGLQGWELEESLAKCRASLAKKRYVSLDFEGNIKFSEQLCLLVGVCVQPDYYRSFSQNESLIFFREKYYVSMTTENSQLVLRRLTQAEIDVLLTGETGGIV